MPTGRGSGTSPTTRRPTTTPRGGRGRHEHAPDRAAIAHRSVSLKPSRLVAIALAATSLGVVTWLGACSDSGGPPDPVLVSQGPDSAIVSDPVPIPAAAGP